MVTAITKNALDSTPVLNNKLNNYSYYKVDIKLLTEQLGTMPQASIFDAHILKKAQKLIKVANKLGTKVTKAVQKYVGTDPISEIKEIAELQGVIRRYQEVLGKRRELPDTPDELVECAKELELDFEEKLQSGEEQRATIFMRDASGKPILSSHMILGNLKENLKIITNNNQLPKEDRLAQTKVSIGEMLALDVKPIEPFMHPNKDILRTKEGKPYLLERPISFDRNGKRETAISLSEVLPAGTEYSVTLRVRSDSPLNRDQGYPLRVLLDLGKNNGMGSWRGSGGKGAYCYRIKPVKNPAKIPEGWC